MIQPTAICHRWLRRAQPRLRAAFVREAREALAPEPGTPLDDALTVAIVPWAELSNEQVRAVADGVRALIGPRGNVRRGSSFLISWGFMEAKCS